MIFKVERKKTITERAFADRHDNYIIATTERLTKKFFGIPVFTRITEDDLKSIDAEIGVPVETRPQRKKSVGFAVNQNLVKTEE